jgi:AcrR family transcriptional regulator
MARPREFDEDRALDAAMHAFWAHGYEATTTQELCAATGLGRSSIYNTFRSKHHLFSRSLEHYLQTMTAAQLEILESGQPPTQRLRALFDRIVAGEFRDRRDGRSIGCLSVNTTVEPAGQDPAVAELLARDLDRRLGALRAVIESGQRDGSITRDRKSAALARFLNAAIAGMRVSAQGGADRTALQEIAAITLSALRP